jgi:glycosyltransferase involved in cell wall biosynthesis
MQAGFDHARGDVIVSLDGDLQNDPADIPKLLDKIEEGYDLVSGWRKHRKDKTITRIMPSKIANWLIAKITGVPIHDNGCSLKAYRSSVIKAVTLYSDMHRFIPAVSTLAGARIAEMVVNHRPRKFGKTKYGLSRIWKVFYDVLTVKMIIHFNQKPLVWFTLLSLPFLFLAIITGTVSVTSFFQGSTSIVFLTVSFLSVCIFANLLFLGLFAEYVVKVGIDKDYNHD